MCRGKNKQKPGMSSLNDHIKQNKKVKDVSTNKDIKVLYANCRSLVGKIDDLRIYLSALKEDQSPAIISLVETWLNDSKSNEE